MNRAAFCSIALCADAGPDGRQWVQLLPLGELHGRDGRGPWRVAAADQVIERTRRHAGKVQLPIDYDHQLYLGRGKGTPAVAAGWIVGLQARSDGVWGLVEWTDRAATMIRNREFRYISPVFHHTHSGEITQLLAAGLTNLPNLDLTALASAGADLTMNPEDILRELRSLLGIGDDEDAGAILDAVRALTTAANSQAPDPARFVPIGDFERVTGELNRLNQGVSLQAATSAVEREIERGSLPPFLKEWGISVCSINKPAFDAFVERTGPSVRRLFETQLPGAHFRPGSGTAGNLTSEEQAVCSVLGHSADDFRKHGRS